MKARIFQIGFLWAMVLPLSLAAQGLDNMVFTVGTTIQDHTPEKRHWAYIVWQGTDPSLLQNRCFAVYAKAGEATNTASEYQRKAIVSLHTDPRVIEPLLHRAQNLGEDLPTLDYHLTQLFQKLIPTNEVARLPEKLSAVIRGAIAQEQNFNNLIHLARQHPGVNLCLGTAHAERIADTGKTTFEIRDYDLAKNTDRAVIGRVTVEAGKPVVLPATGAPVALPDKSSKGNLNVKLRWATPDDLHRVSLLNYGFNVYRMTKAYAESQQFAGPGMVKYKLTSGLLRGLAGVNPAVKQVNTRPILNEIDFDAATVTNFDTNSLGGDASTFFVADDNGRFQPGGVPFVSGEKFYYFATARDILGRDGVVSAPSELVVVCERMPPPPPRALRVENTFAFTGGQPKQALRVVWRQNTPVDGQSTANYYVYRWHNVDEINAGSVDPKFNRIAGPIAQLTGQVENSYTDQGPGAPNAQTNAGQTFWYTVRAEDVAADACEANLSGNSPPAYGVIRTFDGPDAPSGNIEVLCAKPKVVFSSKESGYILLPTKDAYERVDNTNEWHFRLVCARTDAAIAWAEFYYFDPAATTNDYMNPNDLRLVARKAFPRGQNAVSVDFTAFQILPSELSENKPPHFYCRVGSSYGDVSSITMDDVLALPYLGLVSKRMFRAEMTYEKDTKGRQCVAHATRTPDGKGVNPIKGNLAITPRSKEWRVYRRVDGGDLTLVVKGQVGPFPIIVWSDPAMPVNAASICYYYQTLDEHGNASPLAFIKCVDTAGTTPLPTPMLSPIVSGPGATETNATMRVRWFCPPQGVDHFEVAIATSPATNTPAMVSDGLSTNTASQPNLEPVVVQGVSITEDFKVYRTGRVGGSLGNGPEFAVTVNILSGVTNTVFIRPVDKNRNSGGVKSNGEQYRWSPVEVVAPKVPWPARPLAPVNPNFASGILAKRLPDPQYPVGVRIGEFLAPWRFGTNMAALTPGLLDPATFVFKESGLGHTNILLPFVLYRFQTVNANFPGASGDILQVSPLMERIAYITTSEAKLGDQVLGPAAYIVDPYLAVYERSAETAATTVGSLIPRTHRMFDIFMRDTQPVIVGARYQYLVVRFLPNGEIDQVIPTNEVDITP